MSTAPPKDALAEFDVPFIPERPRTPADRRFRALLLACSSTVLVIIVGIVIYLIVKSLPAIRYQGLFSLIFTDKWNPRSLHPTYGFFGDLVGSVVVAVIALIVALPLSVATALAINEYAPRQLRRPLTTLVDLLAALPSLVFGMWGRYFFQKHVFLTDKWLGHHTSFFPPFRLTGAPLGSGLFEAGLVVGIMIIPIITSISREIMSLAPREDCEAALALGGTRWGMVTDVILPFARSGIIGSAMLGLGRALGETIAVSVILSQNERLTSHVLESGGGAIAPLIVHEFLGSSTLEQSALMAAGLTLFALTLAVNIGARTIVLRAGTT